MCIPVTGEILQKRKIISATNILITLMIWGTAAVIYRYLDNATLVIPAAGAVFCLYIFSILYPDSFAVLVSFCFRFRWILALILFVICISLKLSGSSIGMFNVYLPTRILGGNSTLFGQYRDIRTDEWAVQTPTFFSQFYNNYRLFSEQMSLTPMNMVMDYYSPVWDIIIIGKPLAWGYLLFGNEIGLSWYWCGQLILLFMVSLELFLILTEKSIRVSIIGALMICLSPNIQWWFLPHMPIVILYAESLFVIGYHYFTTRQASKRWLFSALSIIAVVGFALSIFPSFQVPCFYIVVALLAACLFRDRNSITFSGKQWSTIVLPLVAVVLILVHFYRSSWESVLTVLNSAYPGDRLATGGDRSISDLFTNLSSLTLPYRNITYQNNCEVSTYVHFAPFFVILSPRLFFNLNKIKKSAAPGYILLICLIVSAYYMVIGIPETIAKLTLLKYCNRMNGVYGWCATLFSVWGLSILLRYPKLLNNWQKVFYIAAYALLCFIIIDENLLNYLSSIFSIAGFKYVLAVTEIVVLVSILFFAVIGNRKITSAILIAIMFFCGATVNPIERGISAVTDHPLCATVSKIVSEEPDSLWINCTEVNFLSNLLAANGAKTLSATNYYYDKEKWRIIDPDGKFENYTNRYSNQTSKIVSDSNSVELIWLDSICFSVTPETIKSLGIRYLLTKEDYSPLFSQYNITCRLIDGQDNYWIYRLDY